LQCCLELVLTVEHFFVGNKLEENVKRNLSDALDRVDVKYYSWGSSVDALAPHQPPWDIIIASDVLYDWRAVNPLIKSLCLLSSPKTRIIMANKLHDYESNEMYIKALQLNGFSLTRVPREELDPCIQDEKIDVQEIRRETSVSAFVPLPDLLDSDDEGSDTDE
jgi:hypothetical protein